MQKNNCNKLPEISIVVVGDSQCGKTQLMNRFTNGGFSEVSMAITWGFFYVQLMNKLGLVQKLYMNLQDLLRDI